MSVVLFEVDVEINTRSGCYLPRELYAKLADVMDGLRFRCIEHYRRGEFSGRETPSSCIKWRGAVSRPIELSRLMELLSEIIRAINERPGNFGRACRDLDKALLFTVRDIHQDIIDSVRANCERINTSLQVNIIGISDMQCLVTSAFGAELSVTVDARGHEVDVVEFFADPAGVKPNIYGYVGLEELDEELKGELIDELSKRLVLTQRVEFPERRVWQFPLFRTENEAGIATSDLKEIKRIVTLKGHLPIVIDAVRQVFMRHNLVPRIDLIAFNKNIPTKPETALVREVSELLGGPARIMAVRQYQLEVIGSILENLRRFGRATIEVATGGGKTEIAIATVMSIINEITRRITSERGRVTLDELVENFPIALVLTIRRDLVKQFAERARQYGVPAIYAYGTGLDRENALRYGQFGVLEDRFVPPPIVAFSSMSFYYSLMLIASVMKRATRQMTVSEIVDEILNAGIKESYESGKRIILRAIDAHIATYLMSSSIPTIEEQIRQMYGIRYSERTNSVTTTKAAIEAIRMVERQEVLSQILAEEVARKVPGATREQISNIVAHIISRLRSVVRTGRQANRPLLEIVRSMGSVLSKEFVEFVEQIGLKATGIIRMDELLIRFLITLQSTRLIHSLMRVESIVDDTGEIGADEISKTLEQLYETSINIMEEVANIIPRLVWYLIFNKSPLLLVIDEAHHTPANSFIATIMSFPNTAVLGMSATPYRGDKLDQLIYGMSGQIVASVPSSVLISQGYLSLPVILIDRYDISVDNPQLYNEFKTVSELGEAIRNLRGIKIDSNNLSAIVSFIRSVEAVANTTLELDVYNILSQDAYSKTVQRLFEVLKERHETSALARRQGMTVDLRIRLEELNREMKRIIDRLTNELIRISGKENPSALFTYLRTYKGWARTAVYTFIARRAVDEFIKGEISDLFLMSILRTFIQHMTIAIREAVRNTIVHNEKRTEHIVDVVSTAIRTNMWPVVVMATFVDYANILYRAIRDRGIKVGIITSKHVRYFDGAEEKTLSISERYKIYEMVRNYQLQVLIGTTLLDEGIDIPNIKTIVLAYAFKSVVGTKQRIGRGLRSIFMEASDDPRYYKPFLLVVDILDAYVRTEPAHCRTWWYCSEPLWIKARVDYMHVTRTIEELVNIPMGHNNLSKICAIYSKLSELGTQFGRVGRRYILTYGIIPCIDALGSMIERILASEGRCGDISTPEELRNRKDEIQRGIATKAEPVLRCDKTSVYDVYGYVKRLMPECVSAVELLTC